MRYEVVPATAADELQLWPIFRDICAAGETYAYGDAIDAAWFHNYWYEQGTRSFVIRQDGVVLGSYSLRPLLPGLADHMANASFIVNPHFRGHGVGRVLGEHALYMAKEVGFLAMLFRFVVSTNEPAVKLWKSLGFSVIGTIPNGFRHKKLGLVDVYIMHRSL